MFLATLYKQGLPLAQVSQSLQSHPSRSFFQLTVPLLDELLCCRHQSSSTKSWHMKDCFLLQTHAPPRMFIDSNFIVCVISPYEPDYLAICRGYFRLEEHGFKVCCQRPIRYLFIYSRKNLFPQDFAEDLSWSANCCSLTLPCTWLRRYRLF